MPTPDPSARDLFADPLFPRSSDYHPDWIAASASSGANSLWLTEWLSTRLDLQPDMTILDLGCGRAGPSIFLAREFGVTVWATDLWFNPSENRQRIADAGLSDKVFPIHADARSLPYATEAFDVIVSIDSFPYYGTDDHYLGYLTRYVKPGGTIAIAGAGLVQEIEGTLPEAIKAWWTAEPAMWCLHSPAWWRRHWERSGIVDVELADTMPDGWKRWLQWQRAVAPDNTVELEAVENDQGEHMGYLRVIARRRPDATLEEPITSIPSEYTSFPLLRGDPK